MKVLFVLSMAVLSLAAGAFYWGENLESRIVSYMAPAADDPVPTVLVSRQDYRLLVPAKGKLMGLKTIPVRVPRVRGSLKVSWLQVEGTLVDPNEVVIRFDDSDARLSLEESENRFSTFEHQIRRTEEDASGLLEVLEMDKESADTELAFAENQIRKDETIFSKWEIQESLISAALAEYKRQSVEKKGGLEERRSHADASILEIDQQESSSDIELARETLSSLELRAPEEGILLYLQRRYADLEVGTEVWSREILAEIASLKQFRAIVHVLEKDIAGVEEGKETDVFLEAFPHVKLRGRIESIDRVAKQITRRDPRKYFECAVLLDVPAELIDELKPGLALEVEIEVDKWENVVVLPKSALIAKDATFTVFVQESDDYREQPVEILASDYGFSVVKGLEEEDIVCLQHPYESQQLVLPDFSAPSSQTQSRRFQRFD